jgi:hypothetical protein
MTLNDQIAEVANVSVDVAKQIRDYIDEEIGIDWSECAERTFKSAVKQAVKEMAAKA